MAVQIETQGQLQEFLGILKRRKWQVLLPASIVLALGIALAVIVPKKYVARTQIELRPVGVSISSKEGSNASFQIRSPNRIVRVLRESQHAGFLALSPDDQGDFIKDVQSNIKVTPGAGTAQGTQVVSIEYMDVSREWALTFLRALSTDWTADVLDRDRRKAEDELDKLAIEKGKLERELADQAEKISDLKRRHSLSLTQPPPGTGATRNEDPVYERLTRAQSELDASQREIVTLTAERNELQSQHDEMPAFEEKESLVEGSTHDAELAEVETQIDDVRERMSNLKPANSAYVKYQRELEKLERLREEVRAQKTQSSLELTRVENPERKPLEKQIAALDVQIRTQQARVRGLKTDINTLAERLAELQGIYRDLSELEGRHGRLAGALDAAEKAYYEQVQKVEFLSSPEASPFTTQEDVNAGTKPTEPNPFLIVSFALVLGLALGLAVALVAEFSRNCFRSVADISRVMVVPVLGAIGTILTRRERQAVLVRRAAVGLTSAVLVGAILFVTWAWAAKPELLSQDLRDGIESLRSQLK